MATTVVICYPSPINFNTADLFIYAPPVRMGRRGYVCIEITITLYIKTAAFNSDRRVLLLRSLSGFITLSC
jgi:hypothetical protein